MISLPAAYISVCLPQPSMTSGKSSHVHSLTLSSNRFPVKLPVFPFFLLPSQCLARWPLPATEAGYSEDVSVSLQLRAKLKNQQTMGSNCARAIDVTHDIERRPTTTETRVAYDNATWHAMNTTYINPTKETSSKKDVP